MQKMKISSNSANAIKKIRKNNVGSKQYPPFNLKWNPSINSYGEQEATYLKPLQV